MKREDIEKAARMFVCDTKTDAEGKILRQKGFKKGAEWRINSVWHDAAEEPERETAIIVLFSEENHEMETVYYTYDSPDDCWEEIKENHTFSKWAYVEDLLPNMEE